MDFLRRSLGLGRRLTTAAQAAPAGVEQASLAAADLKGKLLDDVNKRIKENPSLRYVWAVGGALIVGGSALYHKIHSVEFQVKNVEVGLNEKIHSLGVKLKDELHDQLGQMRGELSSNLLAMRASMERSEDKLSAQMERSEDKLSAQIEITNETLAQLLKRLS